MSSNDDSSHERNWNVDQLRKQLLVALIFFTFAFALMMYCSSELPSISKYHVPNIIQSERDGYYVHTSGCQMPKLDPFSPEVKALYRKITGFYPCSGSPSFIEVAPMATLKIRTSVLYANHGLKPADANCTFEPIIRLVDDDKFHIGTVEKLSFNVPLDIDAVRVRCYKNKTLYHEEYAPLVRLKKIIEKPSNISHEKPLNVIIIGVDSVSKLNFQRHFPMTRNFLQNFVRPIELKGYNKVGENTFPNLLALLTGIRMTDAFKNQYKNQVYDDLRLIWKDFAEHLGHRTLMVEDNPTVSLFNHEKKGFKTQPSDYYFRPFAVAVESSSWYQNGTSHHCFGSKNEITVVHDHLLNFVKTMDREPFFAFVFNSRLTHFHANYAGFADLPFFNLFKSLSKMGTFNNTLVIFMSDHGTRFGAIRKTYVGRFEEHWPVMFLSLPQWFYRQNPDIYYNLRLNQNRLTTPFDVYATLKNLLAMQSGNPLPTREFNERGVSLFGEVPEDRTCNDAGISEHFCTCHQLTPVNVNTNKVHFAALRLVDVVNQWLEPERSNCVFLKLKYVMSAHVTRSSSAATSISGVTGHLDYLIAVVVSPSDAELEGTLRWTRETGSFEVLGDVSRINLYGDQSHCIQDVWLKKYCFCKSQ